MEVFIVLIKWKGPEMIDMVFDTKEKASRYIDSVKEFHNGVMSIVTREIK